MQPLDSRPHRGRDHESQEEKGEENAQLPERQRQRDDPDDDQGRDGSFASNECHGLIIPSVGPRRNSCRTRLARGEAARVRRELGERIYLDSRRHGVVLAPALARAFLIAATGGFLFSLPWPSLLAGTALVVAAALLALRAVWRWERTHVVMTDDQLALVRGTLRRRTAAVRLERVGAVEVDQSLVGRLLGYGTLIAGPLEITFVPQPRSVYGLVESRSP